MFENLEQIKQAIDIEIKYQYINIRGKEKTFSKFICDEIWKEYKKSKKNPKWAVLLEFFERYSTSGVFERRKAINIFINAIKAEKQEKLMINDKKLSIETPITYIKGVGAKLAYRFNKLGIFTVSDLLFYFPKRHIDYSQKALIKNLQVGSNSTIFGIIKHVQAFNSPKSKLGIMKVRVNDESGFIDLHFFFAKSNRVMLERMKAQ